MIDGSNTSPDWQKHPTDILILPVGAFEQHSVHMPLNTDTLQADYFAKKAAEGLDAALLPTLSIATSMEHTGFRGSFSLKPETLMQVIRDIADEAMRQNFKILIVLNGHGGNHALVPVCRDINRRDLPLKIILLDYWILHTHRAPQNSPHKGLSIHSDRTETSIMMALHPALVRENRADAQYPEESHPLMQGDLTTFGVGQMNPTGAVGWPSEGTAEQGRAVIADIEANLVPYLKDRIARLRQQWRYAGSGGQATRALLPSDVPAAMDLKTSIGWNQSPADWEMFLQLNPKGCLARIHQGRLIATLTSYAFENKVGWLAMVLVDPAFRRMGIATRIMEDGMAALDACPIMKLDASVEGRMVYQKMGFINQYEIHRMAIDSALPVADADGAVNAIAQNDLPGIFKTDRAVFGLDRSPFLLNFHQRNAALSWKLTEQGKTVAYAFGRQGSRHRQIGPLVADTADQAIRLLRAILASQTGQPLFVDVPDSQTAINAELKRQGFRPVRGFMRMVKGKDTHPGKTEQQFATGGPDVG